MMNANKKSVNVLMLGMSENDIRTIQSVLCSLPNIEVAMVFGSRAKGNFRNGSDIDIALQGERLMSADVRKAHDILNEETTMPYKFDVVGYNFIQEPALREHIDCVGVLLFEREPLAVIQE